MSFKLTASAKVLSLTNREELNSGEANITDCIFTFDTTWDGYTKTVVFYSTSTAKRWMPIESNTCVIPWENLVNYGMLYFGLIGIKGDQVITTNYEFYPITEGADYSTAPLPTEDVYVQIIGMMQQQAVDASVATAKAAESSASATAAAESEAYSYNSELNAKASENTVKDIQQSLSGTVAAAVEATGNANTAADHANNVADTYASQLASKANQTALDTETTNRTNAVYNEKAERLTEIAVERARINILGTLTQGSTTGDAELIDSRIDAYGVSKANAGSSVRSVATGFGLLLNDDSPINLGSKSGISVTWELGTIDSSGNNTSVTTRIRTKDKFSIPRSTTFSLKSTSYYYNIFTYSSAGVYESSTGYTQAVTTLSDLTKLYRLVIKRSDDANIITGESSILLAYSEKMKFITDLEAKVTAGEAEIKSYADVHIPSIYDTYTSPIGITLVGYDYKILTPATSTTRARFQQADLIVIPVNSTKIRVKAKYNYYLSGMTASFYDSSYNYVTAMDSGWHTTVQGTEISFDLTLTAACKYVGLYFSVRTGWEAYVDLSLYSVTFDIDNYSKDYMKKSSYAELIEKVNNRSDRGFEFIKGIAHRGYSYAAPENTIPAYVLAKRKGFLYAECDIDWTSDGVPVLLHDSTVDRTSEGTGNINEITLATAKTYDFGSWFSSEYTGTRIPTFEEFIICCKRLGLSPYIELKSYAAYDALVNEVSPLINQLISIVKKYKMEKNVTWISFYLGYLGYVRAIDADARIGFVADSSNLIISTDSSYADTIGLAAQHYDLSTSQKTQLATFVSGGDIFLNISYSCITSPIYDWCASAGIDMETWVIDASADAITYSQYVNGIATNRLNIKDVLLGAYD